MELIVSHLETARDVVLMVSKELWGVVEREEVLLRDSGSRGRDATVGFHVIVLMTGCDGGSR